MSIRKGKNSYANCEQFVINKLNDLKSDRKLKVFCEDNSLNYNTTSMFLNKRLKTVSPKFIEDCLNALGYHAKIAKEIYYEIKID